MPTPLIQLQQRNTEIGRIRIGEKVPTSGGKSRPAKLETFRLTSRDRTTLERVAEVYGGEVREWERAFEVYTTAVALNVALLPGRSLSAYYEHWGKKTPRSKGITCLRRCDGSTELLTGGECYCEAHGLDPRTDRDACKFRTRLSVIIRDVPTLGLWRLDTGSFYATVELPANVELIEQLGALSGGKPVPARLRLEQRDRQTDEGTRRFAVPVLDVDVSLDAIYSSTGALAAPADDGRRSLASSPTASRPVAVLTAGDDLSGGADGGATLEEAEAILEAKKTAPERKGPRSAEPVGAPAPARARRTDPIPEEEERERPVAGSRAPVVAPEGTPDVAGRDVVDDEARKRVQRLVLAAKEAGLESDDDRHAFVEAFTNGRTSSTKEIEPNEIPSALATLVQIKRGKVRLERTLDGPVLVNGDLGIVHSPNPAKAEKILSDDEAVAALGETLGGEVVEEHSDEAPDEDVEEAEIVEDPVDDGHVFTQAEWKEWAPAGVGVAKILRTARALAQERGEDVPTSVETISSALGAAVRAGGVA